MSSNQVNEFSLNLPVSAVEPSVEFAVQPEYADQAAVVMAPVSQEPQPEPSMTIGSPVSAPVDPASVTVYANSINPISYNGDSTGIAAFDVVFSVGIACADGSCKTYQVVKRIGIDKCKIASEVENSAPMSIVEAKIENTETAKPKLSESASRARRLAGLE